jgi:hypothetical protein
MAGKTLHDLAAFLAVAQLGWAACQVHHTSARVSLTDMLRAAERSVRTGNRADS